MVRLHTPKGPGQAGSHGMEGHAGPKSVWLPGHAPPDSQPPGGLISGTATAAAVFSDGCWPGSLTWPWPRDGCLALCLKPAACPSRHGLASPVPAWGGLPPTTLGPPSRGPAARLGFPDHRRLQGSVLSWRPHRLGVSVLPHPHTPADRTLATGVSPSSTQQDGTQRCPPDTLPELGCAREHCFLPKDWPVLRWRPDVSLSIY